MPAKDKRTYYYRRKAEGKCIDCRNFAVPGHIHCMDCKKKHAAFGKKYRIENGEYQRAYNRAAKKKERTELRAQLYEKYGRRCNNPECSWINSDDTIGCNDLRCLQLDHVDGGGNAEYKSIKSRYRMWKDALIDTSGKYQLLCANCNWIKKHVNGEALNGASFIRHLNNSRRSDSDDCGPYPPSKRKMYLGRGSQIE